MLGVVALRADPWTASLRHKTGLMSNRMLSKGEPKWTTGVHFRLGERLEAFSKVG